MSATDFDSIDFFDAGELYDDPYPYYEYCRSHGPVWQEPHHGVYMVTGYDECQRLYHDTEAFSNAAVTSGPFAPWPEPLEGDDISATIEKHRDVIPFSDQLPSFDPPKHTAHRSLLGRLITPKRLKEQEEFMWTLADQRIDTFIERGECEFLWDYAGPFTLFVVAELLGVPREQHEQYRQELQGDDSELRMASQVGPEMEHKPLSFLYERFTKFIEDRRKAPQDDVMTLMANARFPDGTLPEPLDVALIAANLFSAGGETTARLLGQMLKRIGEDPEMQQRLRDDRGLITNFIEEILRLDPPIQCEFRLARLTTELGGVKVPAGSNLLVLAAAANRDPAKFEAPGEFRLGRSNYRQHFTFGSGVHACAGAPLARGEARISAERLFDRVADIRISEKAHGPAGERRYEWTRTHMLRGLQKLHLEFTPIG